jgi:hypothetical protein
MFFWIKNEVTYRNHSRILTAIRKSAYETGDVERANFLFPFIEPYYKTLFRFWDFGYENILPKEYFELIKPYIRRK